MLLADSAVNSCWSGLRIMTFFSNRFEVPRAPVWVAAFTFGLLCSMSAAAEEMRPDSSAANIGAAVAFSVDGPLDDAGLRAVSGFGVDPAAGAGMASQTELSVILFDEVGPPKRPKPEGRHTGNSTVTRGINVRVGR